MKIIMNDCVYVQKNDLIFLWNHEHEILSSIFIKVFGYDVVIIDDSNRYEFVKFDAQEEIEYFKKLDWIIDYNLVKDLNKIQFIMLGEEIVMELNYLSNKFEKMDEIEKENNLDIVEKIEKLEFKMYTLRDILWYKQGKLKMVLPEGVEYPNGYVSDNKKIKGLKRILSKFKKH